MTERGARADAVTVILSAGQGTRMGAGQNKVYLPLGGKPLLVRTVEAFAATEAVASILLVAHPNEVEYCRREVVQRYGLVRVRDVIAGGQTRHQSEERALAALRSDIEAERIDVVAIHDGARPFVTPEEIERVVAAARDAGGALLATPVPADEVVARVAEDGAVVQVYPSAELWRAQTPQAFLASRLLAAYDAAREAGYEGTDTAASYERLGYATRVVAGSEANVKITTPEDLLRAEAYLRGG
jgi:2-C-methyl-D-erythritol 4-phosphate cytidylyltransferase